MKKQVLIFDESPSDYFDACESLKKSGFIVKDSVKAFQEQKYALSKDFSKYVFDEINKFSPIGIVCDYRLAPSLKGPKVVKMIRDYSGQNQQMKDLCQKIPIIGYSQIGDFLSLTNFFKNKKINYLFKKAGANAFVNKYHLDELGKKLEDLLI